MISNSKDPNKKFQLTDILEQAKPKRPMMPFFLYSQQMRAELMKKNTNIKLVEIAKLLAA